MLWQEYKSLTMNPECPAEVWVYLACALFFLGLYEEAEEAASKGMNYRDSYWNIVRSYLARPSSSSCGTVKLFYPGHCLISVQDQVTIQFSQLFHCWEYDYNVNEMYLCSHVVCCLTKFSISSSLSTNVTTSKPAPLPLGSQGILPLQYYIILFHMPSLPLETSKSWKVEYTCL